MDVAHGFPLLAENEKPNPVSNSEVAHLHFCKISRLLRGTNSASEEANRYRCLFHPSPREMKFPRVGKRRSFIIANPSEYVNKTQKRQEKNLSCPSFSTSSERATLAHLPLPGEGFVRQMETIFPSFAICRLHFPFSNGRFH